jgi:bifunctional DNase/RNase
MTDRLVEVAVADVLAAVPMGPGQESGLLVLAEKGPPHRALSIYIGQAEARAIKAGLRGEVGPRPSTWDLYLSTLAVLGGRLAHGVVDRVEEGRHFFATLEVDQGERRHLLVCRPSDAVALVVRAQGAVLYATDDVLAAAGRYPEA